MAGRSGMIKFIVITVLLFGIGVIVLNIISYNRRQTDQLVQERLRTYNQQKVIPIVSSGIPADFKLNTKPEKLTVMKDISKIPIQKYKISLNDEKSKDIFVRETGTGNYHILLLHGSKSSSKIWEDIGTLYYLSSWGYRAFAVDIPTNEKSDQWLKKLIDLLRLNNLVIISPSMSGRMTLPYMVKLKNKQKLIRGFVPIAPVGTDQFRTTDYKRIKVPTLIVHGEKDVKFQSAFEKLQQIPTSKIFLMKNASHASYVEKPMEFHNELRQFLYHIYRPIYQKSFAFNTTKFKLKQTRKFDQ